MKGCLPAPRLIDGPEAALATVLLAHGAGAPMDSPFMAAIAGGLAEKGWRVVRFEFPSMARMRETGRRQGPDRMPLLQEAFREQVRLERVEWPERLLFIGGKSMGGRVASLLIDELAAGNGVKGCLCLGYPFHPPGKPLTVRRRLDRRDCATSLPEGRSRLSLRVSAQPKAMTTLRIHPAWMPG